MPGLAWRPARVDRWLSSIAPSRHLQLLTDTIAAVNSTLELDEVLARMASRWPPPCPPTPASSTCTTRPAACWSCGRPTAPSSRIPPTARGWRPARASPAPRRPIAAGRDRPPGPPRPALQELPQPAGGRVRVDPGGAGAGPRQAGRRAQRAHARAARFRARRDRPAVGDRQPGRAGDRERQAVRALAAPGGRAGGAGRHRGHRLLLALPGRGAARHLRAHAAGARGRRVRARAGLRRRPQVGPPHRPLVDDEPCWSWPRQARSPPRRAAVQPLVWKERATGALVVLGRAARAWSPRSCRCWRPSRTRLRRRSRTPAPRCAGCWPRRSTTGSRTTCRRWPRCCACRWRGRRRARRQGPAGVGQPGALDRRCARPADLVRRRRPGLRGPDRPAGGDAGPGSGRARVRSQLDPVLLPGQRATALALVFCELFQNAVEHGAGAIEVSCGGRAARSSWRWPTRERAPAEPRRAGAEDRAGAGRRGAGRAARPGGEPAAEGRWSTFPAAS